MTDRARVAHLRELGKTWLQRDNERILATADAGAAGGAVVELADEVDRYHLACLGYETKLREAREALSRRDAIIRAHEAFREAVTAGAAHLLERDAPQSLIIQSDGSTWVKKEEYTRLLISLGHVHGALKFLDKFVREGRTEFSPERVAEEIGK